MSRWGLRWGRRWGGRWGALGRKSIIALTATSTHTYSLDGISTRIRSLTAHWD